MPTLHGAILFMRPSAYQELKSFPKNTAGSFNSCLGCNAIYSSSEGKPHIVPSFGFNFTRASHYLYRSLSERTTRHWLHRFHVNASSDEDFRSSRNIATSLFKQYKNVIDRGGGDNIKGFVNAGVQAYALGCTEEGLRMELMDIKKSGIEIESLRSYGGGTSLSFKVHSFEVKECILWLSIVFITILCTPQPTIIRWSTTPPVSTDVLHQWKGFCALIANAYYTKGMAWLPVKTLQLEQMAVMGSSEEPSVVASRMQLVFSTLEVVSPQWPRV
ncbi:uncharacterized protein LOC100844215 [Brachypodium distachyon]|uniref:DUF7876 domain-containing protein n=1 Tax=Brachypodium distachyon TaxID=15368 RepID=I1GNE0_BRADI|nr:uncharacterized protein LOC100844215 [Brachypodium distachyon]KQK13252.1 hypothetical protein BRADI_1g08907v3 [Brachypodium distachyon]|eukprot:XP_010230066.1 uncharacterized protein LOC100844215 [Brachypodium distachyon]